MHVDYVLKHSSTSAPELPSLKYPPIAVPEISSAQLNLKDGYRQSAQETPLQFIYEPADCRIWYTEKMFYDYTALWQTAADALWNDSGLCVFGSTGNKEVLPRTELASTCNSNSNTGKDAEAWPTSGCGVPVEVDVTTVPAIPGRGAIFVNSGVAGSLGMTILVIVGIFMATALL